MGTYTLSSSSELVRVVRDENGKNRVEMLCPHCEAWQDILAFKNPNMVRKYAHDLNAIVKCVLCRHVFSPRWTNED